MWNPFKSKEKKEKMEYIKTRKEAMIKVRRQEMDNVLYNLKMDTIHSTSYEGYKNRTQEYLDAYNRYMDAVNGKINE